jgi:hypothetical protein
MALERGDLIRHFAVTTIDGRLFDYDDTRQRRNRCWSHYRGCRCPIPRRNMCPK